MKRSNIIDLMVCKYPSILIGLIITAAVVSPLPALAVTAPAPVVTVEKTTSTSSILDNTPATYTITVSNTSTAPAYNVNVNDVLPGFKYATQVSIVPTGTAKASAVTTKPTAGNGTLNWKISTLPANSSLKITFTASTTGVTPNKYDNSVNIDYYNSSSSTTKITASYNGSLSSAEDVTIQPSPNLTVTNTSPTDSIPTGENATYNITIENKGAGAASNVKVSDLLPTGFKYGTQVSIVPTGTALAIAVTLKPALGDTNLNWNISTLPANSSITISFTASTVGVALGKYNNSVNVEYYTTGSSVKKTAAYNGTTATTEDVTITPLPNLTVTNATMSGYIANGSTAIYQITVKNNSAGKAYNVKITDTLPTGFKYDKELVILTKGAVTPSATKSYVKPVANDTTPIWENYDIPGNGIVTVFFTATGSIPSTASATKFDNSVDVAYASTPAGTSKFTASYAGTSSTVDDVTVKPTPPIPALGTATRSDAVIQATPTTYCGGEPGAAGIGKNITGIVNTYFTPARKLVAAGTNKIDIVAGAARGLNQDIEPGDLLLIVQMQDATITNANNDTYGSGNATNQGSGQSSMGTTGLYEYATADSVVTYANGGTQLKLKRSLINSYVSSDITKNGAGVITAGQKRFQVVRVPQYSSIIVKGTLYAEPWDGNVGGVLAIDTFGKFDLNDQRMSANSVGFRGGFGRQNSYKNALNGYVSPLGSTLGSGKGEGTAGTPRYISTQKATFVDPATGAPEWTGGYGDNIVEGYPGGDSGIGAPANAGGAGNFHNAGGGGGGNGGIGGQGGLSWSNGTNFVPFDTAGRPGYLSSTNNPVPWQLIMGGGGGGGEANNSTQGVPGGAGGGIVMLRAGEIVGSGQIFANGRNGNRGSYEGDPDGAGGAGAGGTVLIQSRNASSANLTIEAKGGDGGSTERDAFYKYKGTPVAVANQAATDEKVGYSEDGYPYDSTPHGPGGGGAGGVVLYNVGKGFTINAVVTGGAAGQTDDKAADPTYTAVSGKTRNPHGATKGSDGVVVPFSNSEDPFNSLNNVTNCSAQLVVKNTPPTVVTQGEVSTFTITVTNAGKFGGAVDVDINSVLPTGFVYSKTDSVTLTNGSTPAIQTTVSNPTPGSTKPSWGQFTLPPDATVEITYQVLVKYTAPVGTLSYTGTATASRLDPGRDAKDPTAKIENTAPAVVDKIEVQKGKNSEMVWNVSPTIRIVRK